MTQTLYIKYVEATGEIRSIGSVDGSSLPEGEQGVTVLQVSEHPEQASHYVSGGQVVPKQSFALQMISPQIVADGVDECVIGNIPTGTTVEWPDGQTDEVTDGEVRFSVDLPSTYTLKFSAIPYLDQEVIIEAVAAA